MQQQKKTVVFLRMTAIELRRLAESAPEIAAQLAHMAQQLEQEADDLAAPLEGDQ